MQGKTVMKGNFNLFIYHTSQKFFIVELEEYILWINSL